MGRITLLILLYSIAFVAIHAFTNLPASCNNEGGPIPISDLSHVIKNSDRFDGHCICFMGEVISSGHWFFDLFFVNTYTLRSNGKSIVVFGATNIPVQGSEISVYGEFRQIYYGHYFMWVGLVESQRFYKD